MLTLMNYWNSVWRSNLAQIEDATFRRHREAEVLAFERRLRQPGFRAWQKPKARSGRYPRLATSADA